MYYVERDTEEVEWHPTCLPIINNKGGSDTDIMHTTPYHASYSTQDMLSIHDQEQEWFLLIYRILFHWTLA